MLGRGRLVRAEVALLGPARAAVLLDPASGRWPAHEEADRLALGVGTCALAAGKTPDARWEPLRELLVGTARGLAAAGEDPLPGDLVRLDGLGVPGALAVVPWDGRAGGVVTADLVRAAGCLVPRLGGAPAPAAVAPAALALLVALGADAGADDRLRLALGVEGLVAWYRDSARSTPPRHALAFALDHAGRRLAEAGRALPPGL